MSLKNKNLIISALIVICILGTCARIARFLTYPRINRDSCLYMKMAVNWFDDSSGYPANWQGYINGFKKTIPCVQKTSDERGNILAIEPVSNSIKYTFSGKCLIFLPAGKYTFSASNLISENNECSVNKMGFIVTFKDGTKQQIQLDFRNLPLNKWHKQTKQITFNKAIKSLYPFIDYQGKAKKICWDDISIIDPSDKQILPNGSFEHEVSPVTAKSSNGSPLLFPFILALLVLSGISPASGSALIGILLTLAMIFCTYKVSSQLFKSKHYGLLAALLIAIHPYLIRMSVSILRDNLYIALVIFAITYAIYGITRKKSWHFWLSCGLMAGLASMTRREGIELFIIIPAWLIFSVARGYFGKKYKPELKHNSISLLCFIAGVLLVLIPLICYFNSLGSEYYPVDLEMIQERLYLLKTISPDKVIGY